MRVVVAALLLPGCLGPPLKLPAPAAMTAGSDESGATPGAKPARAFIIEHASELVGGLAADGKPGDYELANDRIAVVVTAVERHIGFAASGGNIIDAAPVGGSDALKQLYGYLNDTFTRQPVYEHVDLSDDNGTAVLTAHGHDSDDPKLAVETRYSLAPGANAVAITTTLTNGSTAPLAKFDVGDAVEWGRAERFIPGRGFGADGHFEVEAGWIEAIGDDAAYAYVVGEGPLDGRHGWAWSDLNAAQIAELPAGSSVKVTRWLVVGPPSDTGRYQAVASLRKQRWTRLSGRILEESTGAILPDARVLFDDRDGPLALTRSTRYGYEVLLPPGDYHVRAEDVGRSGPERLDVTVSEGGGTSHDVLMSRRGALAFHVREDDRPSPAKLTIFGVPPTVDPRLGPAFASPGGNIAVSATGEGELPLPPGRYRVVASHGPHDTVDERRVDVLAGAVAKADFALKRAVDGFGWRCIDPHQHAFPSSDSAVSPADRMAGDLAEGLDAMAITDHNAIAESDWQSTLEALHPAQPLVVIAGNEVTVERLGHFSVLPFSGSAPALESKTLPELAQQVRAPDRVVILDHPRAGGRTGYFDDINFDPNAPAAREQLAGFDAIEVFSGKDTARVESPLRDWMALLARGITLTAVGGSDSHLMSGQEAGYPRTCIAPDEHGSLGAESLVTALKRRRDALVTNGPFVRMTIAGHGMGQTVTVPRGHAKLELEIEAAPWIDVRRFEIFVNGTRRGKPLDVPASQKPLRYKGEVDLRVDRDSFVVVVVRGDQPMGAVLPADSGQSAPTPLAVTNPIYLDRDGDGKYTFDAAPIRTR